MSERTRSDRLTRRDFMKGTAAGVGTLALMGAGRGEAEAQGKISWRLQSMYASNTMTGKFYVRWAKSVTELTGGRLTVVFAEPGAIVPTADTFQNVSNGTVEAAGSYGAFYRGIIPEIDVEDGLPFAWETPSECHDAYYNRGLLEEIRKIYAEHNIFYVAPCYCNIIYGYPTVRPVRKPADFKGMKIRDLGLAADWVAHYGAAPTALPAGEMYMGLKMKTIDGVHYGTASLEDFKLGEVCKYYLLEPNTGTTVNNIFCNLKAYNALPADIKKLVSDYSQTLTLPTTMEWDEHRSWVESSKKYGIEGIRWSKEDTDSARMYMIQNLWPKVAQKSPRCKKLVDMIVDQARHLGKIK